MRIAVVGAGGKTTLIRTMAEEARRKGCTVLVTTTTHMYIEPDTLLTDDADEIIEQLGQQGFVMAGLMSETDERKMTALSLETYHRVSQVADLVLIEADGSKHLPLKWPREDEPVIWDNVEQILVVVGLHGLNQKAKDAVHRWELAKSHVSFDGNTTLHPSHVQELVMKGYVIPLKEKYPEKEVKIKVAHDDSLYQRAVAKMLEEELDASILDKGWFTTLPDLIICGGGHVSQALVHMASCLNFRIKVMDDREVFANRERFPLADEIICDTFDHLSDHMEDHAYYVVITREHKDDFLCIEQILEGSYDYLGMIGSKGKVAKAFEQLRTAGVSEETISTIHAPIGLKIGAVTPAEIAVCILAEIISVKNKEVKGSASKGLLESRDRGTLCIIIEKEGSSPRGVGSMMLVTEDGIIDSIGGGSVEAAAIEDARTCTHCMVKDYQLNEKDKERLGMICGGRNKVLFIPLD